jgi:MinD superfamily P-loop ATPase
MIISVASGKGGTGKTLVATSLALSLKDRERVHLLDCDVEEPNAHLFLKPRFDGSETVYIPVPRVDYDKCTYCGKCAQVCAFNAIAVLGEQVLTFPQLCHGCGACSYICPQDAITEEGRESGIVEWGQADGIDFIQGRLTVGEAMPLPVIKKVKERAGLDRVVIIDVPPGTSCPVVESIRDSDFCLLVTEPTPFGLNDLILTVETVKILDIHLGIILNRAGIGDRDLEEYCREENIPLLLTIPLETDIARFYSQGVTLAEGMPKWKDSFAKLFNRVTEMVDERSCGIKR